LTIVASSAKEFIVISVKEESIAVEFNELKRSSVSSKLWICIEN